MRLFAKRNSDSSSDGTIAGTAGISFAGSTLYGRYHLTRTQTIIPRGASIGHVDIAGECTGSGKKRGSKRLRGGKVWRPIPLRKLWIKDLAGVRMIREAVFRPA